MQRTHLFAVGLTLALLTACDDPTHQGRSLSSWRADLDARLEYKRRLACEAIEEMGPVAAPAVRAVG